MSGEGAVARDLALLTLAGALMAYCIWLAKDVAAVLPCIEMTHILVLSGHCNEGTAD